MTPERFQEFVNRILAEGNTLDTHFRENPELAHYARLADAMTSIISLGCCPIMAQHWGCLTDIGNLGRYIYSIMTIKPRVLDEIYEEFKADFHIMVPEGFLHWKIVESRQYPIPSELTTPPRQELPE